MPRLERSGAASTGSPSSGFGRFNRFKMVLSGSYGNIESSQSPVVATTLDLALAPRSAGCGGNQPRKEQEGDHYDDEPAFQPEQETQGAVERPDAAIEHHVREPLRR